MKKGRATDIGDTPLSNHVSRYGLTMQKYEFLFIWQTMGGFLLAPILFVFDVPVL